MLKHVEIQRADSLAAFQDGNELPRRNDLPVSEPAAERFCAGKLVIVELGLGLVENLEFLVGDGAREHRFDFPYTGLVPADFIVVEKVILLVNALGELVRCAYPVHDVGRGFSAVGNHVVTRGGSHSHGIIAAAECYRHAGEIALDIVKIVLPEQYNKVVAADPAYAFLVNQLFADTMNELSHYGSCSVPAELVVYRGEVPQIEVCASEFSDTSLVDNVLHGREVVGERVNVQLVIHHGKVVGKIRRVGAVVEHQEQLFQGMYLLDLLI